MTYLIHVLGFMLWTAGGLGLVLGLAMRGQVGGEKEHKWTGEQVDSGAQAQVQETLIRLLRGFGRVGDVGMVLAMTGGVMTVSAHQMWPVPWIHHKLALVSLFACVYAYIRLGVRREPGRQRWIAWVGGSVGAVLLGAILVVAVMKL